ncbi:1655_t:CDS:2 [Entrophospora sp. SA101]|nr:1655_t:CDS:2 [Entrophospora sp. SA101]
MTDAYLVPQAPKLPKVWNKAGLVRIYIMLRAYQKIILKHLERLLKIRKDNNLPVRILSKSIKEFQHSNTTTSNHSELLIRERYFNLLYKAIIRIPLNFIDYDMFNYESLVFILTNHDKEKTAIVIDEEFNTSEYDVFRYVVFWALSQLKTNGNFSMKYFEVLLPILNYAENLDLQDLVELKKLQQDFKNNISENINKKILILINPLLLKIDFKLIHPSILINIIEPLEIIPKHRLIDAYKYQVELPSGFIPKRNRGVIFAKPKDLLLEWDQKVHGKNIILSENNKVVTSIGDKLEFARSKLTSFHGSGYDVYEWDILIEEDCKNNIWIGVHSDQYNNHNNSNKNCEKCLKNTKHAWVFGSNGLLYHNGKSRKYGTKYGKDDRITVHLNMFRKSLSFSINGRRFEEAWSNLSPILQPVVSIKKPAKIRIDYKKNFNENDYDDNTTEYDIDDFIIVSSYE